MTTRTPVVIVNTLAGTLGHYASAIAAAVSDEHTEVSVLAVDEPSFRGGSRLGWLRAYLAALLTARRSPRDGTVVITWPVLGYWDVVLARIVLGWSRDVRLVIHDPVSLVRSVGYSATARHAARLLARRGSIIVHSEPARADVARAGLGSACEVLPLPIEPCHGEDPADAIGDRPVIRVLGQYKGERDLQLLRDLPALLERSIALEIHGRGWPEVPGWKVTDAFVSEGELDRLIATASAVLIPYRRFYQSDIAIRAFERGTPFVGPDCDALTQLYGSGSDLLVRALDDRDEWVRALGRAVTADRPALSRRADRVAAAVRAAWFDSLTPARRPVLNLHVPTVDGVSD